MILTFDNEQGAAMRHGYLIDMDGVIYRGAAAIEGAADFIRYLAEERTPYLFLTNNSTFTPLDVVVKLRKFEIETAEAHVYTSAMATAEFVQRQKPDGTAFVIGEGGLLTALRRIAKPWERRVENPVRSRAAQFACGRL